VLDHSLVEPRRGDLFAAMTAGADGATQSGTHSSRPPAPEFLPEVLVRNDEWGLIRPRVTAAELIALDRLPGWL
jgi:diaminopimelate decarboxylase